MEYTFDADLFSDLHKDAYGFRPRGHYFYADECTDDERQEIWDQTLVALDASIREEEELKQRDLMGFELWLEETIRMGARDEQTALRWMTQDTKFHHMQDVEHWVWEQGILFTDRGREVVKTLANIVTFEKWAA